MAVDKGLLKIKLFGLTKEGLAAMRPGNPEVSGEEVKSN